MAHQQSSRKSIRSRFYAATVAVSAAAALVLSISASAHKVPSHVSAPDDLNVEGAAAQLVIQGSLDGAAQ